MKHYFNPRLIYRIFYCLVLLTFVLTLLSANRCKIMYSPYQLLIWEIKANEGFRSTWYPDGVVRGQRAYSIGFGWNDQGNRRRKEIAKFVHNGRVSFSDALQITLMELHKYGTLNSDPYRNVALKLYSYNCGLTKDGSNLGKCCGSKWGCGNKNRNIRKIHNRRRKFELALWNHDVNTIVDLTEENRQNLINVISILKSKGEL